MATKDYGWEYRFDYGGREKTLVIDFTDTNIVPSLDNRKTLKGVLRIMVEEGGVDSVVLAHYEETEYYGSAMEILKAMVDFIDSIEEFAMRDPKESYFDYLSDGDKKKLKCPDCPFNPGRIFNELKESFLEGTQEYEETFEDIVYDIDRFQSPYKECDECTFSTLEDLEYMRKKYEEVYKTVNREYNEGSISS